MGRRKHGASFKSQVALEAIRNEGTVAEIAKRHGVHPSRVQAWKAALISGMASIFDKEGSADTAEVHEAKYAVLERKVGQLTIENDFLKKKWQHCRSEYAG